MLSLIWPWMLALAPLPWLYRWWRKPADDTQAALLAPVYAQFGADSLNSPALSRRNWPSLVLLTLIWLACLLAASRPQWIGEPIALPTSGRDLLLAVDISGSMEVEDMEVNGALIDRLSVVKAVVGDFVQRRSGDRLGLVLFGDHAYLQTPLTFDRLTLNTLLQEALIGFAGKGTAIGDAIGLGVKRLKDKDENSRVIILLTDGANTAGEVEPLKAAELAAAYGVKIYTIGVGADEILRRSLFGVRRVNPSADLDETTLRAIAEQTGGQYFRARNPQELMQIYATLDQLEPVSQDAETFRPTRALFYWPLAAALLFSGLLLLVRGLKA
ncbi:MAG: VWA domain-containing protein [Gammaproteobacteria bacterium]|nr:VWA domain-containing protein [Gammaproteobacteria bacterium]MBQ0840402.1 VWA domain-containing protein [Gammaproteobacteria bacterium]